MDKLKKGEKIKMSEKEKQEIDVVEIVKSSMGALKEGLKDQMLNELKDSLKWTLNSAAEQVTAEFVEKELKPELMKHLVNHKAAILINIKKSIDKIGVELGKRMSEVALEKIKDMSSYNFEDIMKKIF